MAKELPYFRFTVQEWQNGDISIEDYKLQGFFINLCCYYWLKDCNVTLSMVDKKFPNDKILVEKLINLSIIKHEKNTDFLSIIFLNEQFDVLSDLRKARVNAGSKGGKQKSSKAKAKLKQNSSYKDKNKDNNKDKDKDKSAPLLFEVIEYFKLNGYTESSAIKAFNYYNSNNWNDKNNKKVVDWKLKMQSVWFKDENKIVINTPKFVC